MYTNNSMNNENQLLADIEHLSWETDVSKLETAFASAKQGLAYTKVKAGMTDEPSPDLQRQMLEMSMKLAHLTKICLSTCISMLRGYEAWLPSVRVIVTNKNRTFTSFDNVTVICQSLAKVEALAAEVVSLLQEIAATCNGNSDVFCSLLICTKQVMDESIQLTSVLLGDRGTALVEKQNQKANVINFFANLLNQEANQVKENARQSTANRFAYALHEGLHRCLRDDRLSGNSYVCLRGGRLHFEALMRDPWQIDNLELIKVETSVEYRNHYNYRSSSWYELYCLSYELLLAKGLDRATNHSTTVDLTAEINDLLSHLPEDRHVNKLVIRVTQIDSDALHQENSSLPAELLKQYAETKAYLHAWQQVCRQLVIDLDEQGDHQFAIAVRQPIENAIGTEQENMNLELEFSGSVSKPADAETAHYFMEPRLAMIGLERDLKFVMPSESGMEISKSAWSSFVNHSTTEGEDRTRVSVMGASAKVRVVAAPKQETTEQH